MLWCFSMLHSQVASWAHDLILFFLLIEYIATFLFLHCRYFGGFFSGCVKAPSNLWLTSVLYVWKIEPLLLWYSSIILLIPLKYASSSLESLLNIVTTVLLKKCIHLMNLQFQIQGSLRFVRFKHIFKINYINMGYFITWNSLNRHTMKHLYKRIYF